MARGGRLHNPPPLLPTPTDRVAKHAGYSPFMSQGRKKGGETAEKKEEALRSCTLQEKEAARIFHESATMVLRTYHGNVSLESQRSTAISFPLS